MLIPNNSVVNALEKALNASLLSYLGVTPLAGSLAAIPQEAIALQANIQAFSDASGTDPIARVVKLDRVNVGLFLRTAAPYHDARSIVLNLSEHLITGLRKIRSGGISGSIANRLLINAFAGLTLEGNPVQPIVSIADNKAIEASSVLNFSCLYEYTDFTDVDVIWGETMPALLNSTAIVNDIPSGAIDGVNATFVSNRNFMPETVEVYWQGQRLDPTEFSTVGINAVTLTFSPPIGSIIVLSYWVA
jgi:hypothetical protein